MNSVMLQTGRNRSKRTVAVLNKCFTKDNMQLAKAHDRYFIINNCQEIEAQTTVSYPNMAASPAGKEASRVCQSVLRPLNNRPRENTLRDWFSSTGQSLWSNPCTGVP